MTEPKTVDVRTVQSGALIYNLMRYTVEQLSMSSMLAQIDAQKAQQKMLLDPPGTENLREGLRAIQEMTYAMVTEINIRFTSVDAMRIAAAGIENQPEE